jgi:hypothetical protein
MDNQPSTEPAPDVPSGSGGFLFRTLTSLGVALATVTLIALACLVGTLLPQGDQVAGFLVKYPMAQGWMRVLAALGFTDVFSSWWFAALLGLLAACLAACSARRYRVIRLCTGAKRIRVIGSFLAHVSMLLILTGGVIRVFWGEKGVLAIREGETAVQFAGKDGAVPLGFSVHLVQFEVELYEAPKQAEADHGTLVVQWPEKGLQSDIPVELGVERTVAVAGTSEPGYRLTVVRYEPSFTMELPSGEVRSSSQEPNNPAILVSVERGGKTHTEWVFAAFPEFTSHARGGTGPAMPLQFRYLFRPVGEQGGRAIKSFQSKVQFIDAGKVVLEKTIGVNSPVSHGGYTFYQSGFNPEDKGWTSLQVVRDPGVLLVYGGFILMMVGLTVVFCVGPWLDSQRHKPGEMT